MSYRYEFGAGSNSFETVNPANPSEKIGRYGMSTEGLAKPLSAQTSHKRNGPRCGAGAFGPTKCLY